LNGNGLIEPTTIVSGLRCRLIQLRLRFRIFQLALHVYRNPIAAVNVLKALLRKKDAILGKSACPKLIKAGSKYLWSITAAGWPSEAFDLFVLRELNRLQSPPPVNQGLQTIIFSITSRCPLKCEHCYEWNNLSAQETLSLNELQTSIKKFQDFGVCNIQLSGGEPLSRFDDLLTLLRTARQNSEFWILSSGFGLTEKMAKELKEAGLTGVTISLDSWDEAQHNRFRGNDQAYQWALEAAENAGKAGLVVAFSLCAAREFVSMDNLEKYLQLAKNNGATFVRILEPRKVGHYSEQDIELDDAQIEVLTQFYLKSQSVAFKNYPIVEYTGYHQRQHGCLGAGDRYLYVDSKGDIHACPFCQNPVGNAISDPIDIAVAKLKETGCHKF